MKESFLIENITSKKLVLENKINLKKKISKIILNSSVASFV